MEQSLLFNALIYLAAAVAAVPIAKRFGLGAVLGYLLAGMAIGPWGLRLIDNVEDILHFSEFGVVLLLFMIGLELEPKRLWSLRRSIFGWGTAQVALVSLALFSAAVAVGVDWKTALIAALGMSLSSTAIALATINERKLNGTPAGRAGFAILLFQDIAAIPMIAIVPLLGVAVAHGSGEGWIGGLKVLAVIATLIVGGRYLVRPLMRMIARTGLREIFTAFALLLVIAIGLLMESVGMSMALGSFLAGVLLADSEYRHALETDLEPFKGLLLGLFFIAVGMSVDFGLLLSQPWLIVGLVAGFLAIKLTVLFLLSKVFRIARAQQFLFAALLSQGGEFAFVVFGAAATARVFSEETSSILVVVVALSMVTTPLLLVLYDKVIAPYFLKLQKRPDDDIDDNENPVIIAGFGRFGQIIGRLLHANKIGLTVLDHDPDQIELLRKFGFKVFYGDATRIDLMHAAGIAKARLLVVALDDIEGSLKLVAAVRQEFPDLQIIARARNVTHYFDLMDLGVTVIERETFESALLLGREALRKLGFGAYRARQAAMKFRAHNLQTLHDMYPHQKDQQQIVSIAKQAREELEEMFAHDRILREDMPASGWDDEVVPLDETTQEAK
ncbi:glutathione-regulated potassium-efflux system protein KefC [Collimonas pratensis]|uniref:Glutathione-regulated potassium-efflux system protein kefC n=1 Tax=Collimonas pratensis TaxID=279113 RepID=A0A127PYI7_9BURK|nr:glutathione-regulated potassium-efflux system protein KefC [Collimonas pratensis]AMP02858.1 glutathione-regulated potassium-efflux system protein kefC [Collimonas pratensis]AMP12667.1 glutathione-regulated potassium-efflux system protein kefC [Collimonas pratensis]NKI71621.1 glutathione-regulated potassium-efflux system protein KefC [Collimonas pratensis]